MLLLLGSALPVEGRQPPAVEERQPPAVEDRQSPAVEKRQPPQVGEPVPSDAAPDTLSLEEAVALFHEQSVELRLARSRLRRARGRAHQAAAYPNPAFSFLREDLGRGQEDYSENTFSLDQTLEWPGRTLARSRAKSRTIRAAGARHRSDSLALLDQVRDAYLSAAEAGDRVELLEEVTDVVRDAVRAGETRREEGDLSGYELRRLKLEQARLEQELAAARIHSEAAHRELASLILPAADTLIPATRGLPSGRPPALTRADALAAAMRRPLVEAQEHLVAASEARVRTARLERVPDLHLTGGYKIQSDDFEGAVLGVSLSLPLFDRKQGAVQAARAGRDAAQQRLRLRSRRARDEVLLALDRYRSLRRRALSVGEDLLAPSDNLLRIARTAYEAGELELVALLDGANAYRDSRATALQLRAGLWRAYYELQRTMGGKAPGDHDHDRRGDEGAAATNVDNERGDGR